MTRQLVDVTGADEIAGALRRLADDLTDMTDVNRQASDLIGSEVRRRAPRRTGRLAGSVRTQAGTSTATVTVGAPYALPVNARTGFLNQAVPATESARERLYTTHVTDAVRRAGGTTR